MGWPVTRRPALMLLVGVLAAGGAVLVAPSPAIAAPTPMPPRLAPGSWTKPTYPERSVPAYATRAVVRARVRSGSGPAELSYTIPTPAGSSLVWNDWDGDGATTPAVFSNGRWSIYNTMVGAAPAPTAQFSYGTRGDRPITGDWNGDHKADIGVLRGNVWYLRLSASAGSTWRKFRWGLATDRPVIGDWDRDGRDGIGMFRAGRWYLRNTASAGLSNSSFSFGTKGDAPVSGDWNGDRRDTIGVVRGSAWYLRDSPGGGRTQVRRAVTRPSTSVPTAWRTLAGPSGAACPTASPAVANRSQAAPQVRPSGLLDLVPPADPDTDPTGYRLRTALLDAERYLTGAHYAARWAPRRDHTFTNVSSRSSNPEKAIRLPAMEALTIAVAARTRGHNTEWVGRSSSEVISFADWLTRSIACEHRAVTPGGWGHGWQTAHWAMMAGLSGWLLWDGITPQTREYVAQMVVSEADFRLTQPVEYWADAQGAVHSPGDTKAEENSWNSTLLELAVNMMPAHPRAAAWRVRAVELQIASFATARDVVDSATVVNGVSLAARLQGFNAYDDGTVENHSRIHPDYMTNIQHLWWAADLAGLAGRRPPAAAFHNAGLVYGAFSTLSFAPGALAPVSPPEGPSTYLEPGGTIYRTGTDDLYFPQGSTWGAPRRAPFVSFDAHAAAYGIGPSGSWSAEEALGQHVAGQRALQAVNPDGRTYSTDPALAAQQDRYYGREEYAAQQLATAWLARYVGTNRPGPLVLDTATYGTPNSPAPQAREAQRRMQMGEPQLHRVPVPNQPQEPLSP